MATRERLTEQVEEYLDMRGWHYDVTEHDAVTVINFPMGIDSVLSSITEYIFVRDNQIRCFTVSPLKAKEENFTDVVEYLTRANYSLVAGAFEFDYDDGAIRYRDCLKVHGEEAALEDVIETVQIPINMMERYGKGLAKNIMGFGSPEEDIDEAEGRTED